MAQKHAIALYKPIAFQEAREYLSDISRDPAQQRKADSVLI